MCTSTHLPIHIANTCRTHTQTHTPVSSCKSLLEYFCFISISQILQCLWVCHLTVSTQNYSSCNPYSVFLTQHATTQLNTVTHYSDQGHVLGNPLSETIVIGTESVLSHAKTSGTPWWYRASWGHYLTSGHLMMSIVAKWFNE